MELLNNRFFFFFFYMKSRKSCGESKQKRFLIPKRGGNLIKYKSQGKNFTDIVSVIYFILCLFDVTKIRHNNFCFREIKCPVSLDKNYLHSGEELNCLYKDIPVIDLNPILVT